MRVGGSGRTTAASGGKSKSASSKSGEKFSLAEEATDAATSSGVSTASPIGSVDALVALQGVDDSTEGNRKAVEKGEDLLEKLEEIRDGLLMGSVSADRLLRLKETLASYNLSGADPRLEEIVRDIEVRAAVELAKFGY
ncbi:MAG: flagellar biosynthesis protein FlgI [Proteobacteria bacterium]|nr:flagellar biosynthesis protein FlgI [Pseudomonadota bacterium]